jgi:drug/metabolite transporter (DMT)-like permease
MTRLASLRVALPGFGLQGFALIVLGTALLSSMHALVRGVSHEIHPYEIAFFRNSFGFIIFVPWLVRRGLAALRTDRIGLHAMRGVCNSGSMLCWFTALSLIPLAQASALSLVTPIVVAVGASLFLRERVGPARWLAALVGIGGTLVIVRPGFETVGLGTALVLGSSVLAAGSKLFAKELSDTDSAATIVAYVSIFMAGITLVPALFVWHWPDLDSLIRLLAIGVLGTTAHMCIIRSYRWLDVTFVEPFMFLRLPWAAVIGFVVFAEVPPITTWTGGLIIGVGILFLAWHEYGQRARGRLRHEAGPP